MFIRSMIASAIVATLTACGGGGSAGPETSVVAAIPQKCTIELNADSIMAGVGIEKFSASLVKLRPNYVIDDKAIAGLTLGHVHDGYTTVWQGGPVSPIGTQPPFRNVVRTSKVILIELGGNDAYGMVDPVVFRTQLEEMLSTVIAEGRTPVLTGIVPLALVPGGLFDQAVLDRATEFNTIVNELAVKYNVLNAHWRTVEFNGASDTIDGIHWKQIPEDRLVARTIEVLDQACAR